MEKWNKNFLIILNKFDKAPEFFRFVIREGQKSGRNNKGNTVGDNYGCSQTGKRGRLYR